MKDREKVTIRICPACGSEFTERPAISRKDGRAEICPACGIREALQGLGLDRDEQERIVEIVERSYHEN